SSFFLFIAPATPEIYTLSLHDALPICFSDDPEKHIALPYEMVCAADVDELNFLAARLEQLDPAEVGKLNAALQQKNGLANIGQVIDFTYNVDFYVHIPEVHNYHDLGDYYLNQSGMVQMPEE